MSSYLPLIIVGEWWKADTEKIINQALQTGAAPNISDAFTINGLPGPLYNCSAKGTIKATKYTTKYTGAPSILVISPKKMM